MSSHRLLALAAGCTFFASVPSAFAQAIPAEPKPPKNDWTDVPSPEEAPYDESTYDARHRPSTTMLDTTATTTGAEYNYRAGAEEERTYRPNRPMLLTGAILFAAPYATGVVIAAQSNLDADKKNYIPLVGPWLDLGERPCAFGGACTTGDKVGSAFLISSGVAQGVGVILALTSLAVPEHTKTKRTATVQVTPVSFWSGGGLAAAGTF